MLRNVIYAIAFIIIWILVLLPLTPQLYSMIMSYIDNSNVPLEIAFTVKTPQLVYDNTTNTTKTIWVEQPYIVDFKPAIGILLIIVFYVSPPYIALKIAMGRRRW